MLRRFGLIARIFGFAFSIHDWRALELSWDFMAVRPRKCDPNAQDEP